MPVACATQKIAEMPCMACTGWIESTISNFCKVFVAAVGDRKILTLGSLQVTTTPAHKWFGPGISLFAFNMYTVSRLMMLRFAEPTMFSILLGVIFEFQAGFLPRRAVNASNVATICMLLNHFQMLVSRFGIVHCHAAVLCDFQGMTSILSRQIDMEQWVLALPIVSREHAVAVWWVNTWEQQLDELMSILGAQSTLLGQDVTLGDLFDHVENKGIADELQCGCLAIRLPGHVNNSPRSDAHKERSDSVNRVLGPSRHGHQIACVSHGRCTKDGTGYKSSALGCERLGNGVCGVGVDGGAVDHHLALDIVPDDGVDGLGNGFVVGQTDEDHVGFSDACLDRVDHLGLACGDTRAEIGGS